MSFEAFGFLDLPAELRCMLYDNLQIETRRHVLKMTQALEVKHWTLRDVTDWSMTLFRKSLAVAILATCRLIQHEAIEYLRPRLRVLEREPVRFILGYGGTAALSDHYGPLAGCLDNRVSPSSNLYVSEITNRCSSFLEHTHSIALEPQVELIVTRNMTIVYEGECLKAMRGAWSIGSTNNLAVEVSYLKQFPRVMRWDYLQSGHSIEQYVRHRYERQHADFPDGPTFEIEAVTSKEDWTKLLNGEE